MSEMEVKPGYKQTEIGVIPEDWEVKTCESICERISVGVVIKPASYYKENGVIALRSLNIDADRFNLDNLVYFSNQDNSGLLAKSKLRERDIVVVRTGYPGTSAVISKELEGSNCIDLLFLRVNKEKIDPYYISKFFNSEGGEKEFSNHFTGLAQLHLNVSAIKKTNIPLPPLPEQTAIATALSDVDALISGLDRLIEKKRAIKQAAMQELLTGKWRLPGFDSGKGYKQTEVGVIPDDWEFKRIGDSIDLLTGYPFSSTGYTKSGIRLLRGSNIKRGNTDWSNDITQYWPSANQELNKYLLREGDLVIAMDGSLVGRSYALISFKDLPALLLQRVARIRSDKISVSYLTQFIGNDYFINYSDSVKTVTAIPHISSEDIRNFSIPIPSNFEEQTAIATVLSDMDAEISALETRRAKTISLKQGMMQELLTGRIRLV